MTNAEYDGIINFLGRTKFNYDVERAALDDCYYDESVFLGEKR